MDVRAYQLLRESSWIREQRARLGAGEAVRCPVEGCEGVLEPFDLPRSPDDPRVGLPMPGGVRCGACRAESRPVAL